MLFNSININRQSHTRQILVPKKTSAQILTTVTALGKQILMNSVISRLDASVERVTDALLRMDEFADKFLYDPLGEQPHTISVFGRSFGKCVPCSRMNVHKHFHMRTYEHLYMYIYVCVYIYIYIYICIYICSV